MKLRQWIGISCVAVVLCGCSQQKSDTTFTGDQEELPKYQSNLNAISPQAYSDVEDLNLEPGTYISIIGKDSDSAYWKTLVKGVEQAAKDLNEALGYSGSDKIKVIYNAPEEMEDIDEQVNILDEELARNPHAIGIASIDADACTVQFDQATENDIPVIAFDSGNLYKGIQCTCKTDNEEAARTGASKLCNELGDSGKILLLVHDAQSASALERVSGFKEEVASHPEIEIAEELYYDQMSEMKKQIALEYNADREESEAEILEEELTDSDVLAYYLEKNPDIKGIFGTNVTVTQWALAAIRDNEQYKDLILILARSKTI